MQDINRIGTKIFLDLGLKRDPFGRNAELTRKDGFYLFVHNVLYFKISDFKMSDASIASLQTSHLLLPTSYLNTHSVHTS